MQAMVHQFQSDLLQNWCKVCNSDQMGRHQEQPVAHGRKQSAGNIIAW